MKMHPIRLFLTAAIAATAGCSSAFNGPEQALSIAEEHPISVDSQVVTMTIALDPSLDELSQIDKARLRAFADAYLNGGHGSLTVTAPSGADDDLNGQETASDIRRYLYEQGVDWSRITGASYRSGATSRELILSYTQYVATPSECGDWSGERVRGYRNLRSANFGCATQNNLAALVADPHDLVEPAGSTSADAVARVRMLGAFRAGEVTSSATDGAIQAEVSN